MTTFSPFTPGFVETRKSYSLPPTRSEIRPSWGARFSAMSRSAMTLMREMSGACAFFGTVIVS